VGAKDGTVYFLDAESGKELFDLQGHKGPVVDMSFSPDGERFATLGSDGTLRLWDLVSRRELLTIRHRAGFGQDDNGSVSFSPDGRILATSSQWDPNLIMGTGITLWDVSSADWARQLCQIAGRGLTRAEWATYVPGRPYQQICPGQ